MNEPNIEEMKRADLPAIWLDFREQITKLKTTAETLVVTSEEDKAGMKLARQTRLNLREIRIAVEARRKELSEESLRRKQAIDSDAKALRDAIEPLESRLLECEQYAERAEAARAAAKRSKRTAEIIAAEGTPESYNLAECSDDAFAEIIASLLAAKVARLAAAEKAEADRLAAIEAEKAERARVLAENARLAAEAETLRKQAAAREKAQAEERKAASDAMKKQKAEAEESRKKQAAIEAQKLSEQKQKEAIERAAREKAQSDLAEINAKIEAKKRAEIEALAKAAAAPDLEKLSRFADKIEALAEAGIKEPSISAIYDSAKSRLSNIAKLLREKIESIK